MILPCLANFSMVSSIGRTPRPQPWFNASITVHNAYQRTLLYSYCVPIGSTLFVGPLLPVASWPSGRLPFQVVNRNPSKHSLIENCFCHRIRSLLSVLLRTRYTGRHKCLQRRPSTSSSFLHRKQNQIDQPVQGTHRTKSSYEPQTNEQTNTFKMKFINAISVFILAAAVNSLAIPNPAAYALGEANCGHVGQPCGKVKRIPEPEPNCGHIGQPCGREAVPEAVPEPEANCGHVGQPCGKREAAPEPEPEPEPEANCGHVGQPCGKKREPEPEPEPEPKCGHVGQPCGK